MCGVLWESKERMRPMKNVFKTEAVFKIKDVVIVEHFHERSFHKHEAITRKSSYVCGALATMSIMTALVTNWSAAFIVFGMLSAVLLVLIQLNIIFKSMNEAVSTRRIASFTFPNKNIFSVKHNKFMDDVLNNKAIMKIAYDHCDSDDVIQAIIILSTNNDPEVCKKMCKVIEIYYEYGMSIEVLKQKCKVIDVGQSQDISTFNKKAQGEIDELGRGADEAMRFFADTMVDRAEVMTGRKVT